MLTILLMKNQCCHFQQCI